MRTTRIVAALALLGSLFVVASGNSAERRTYVAGQYVVYVDGKVGAFVPSVSGGFASAAVVVERAGAAGAYPKKHAGQLQYEDITFSLSGAVEKPIADWMKTTVNSAQPVRKSGYVASVDYSQKEYSRTTWTDGYISDITFPQLDAASKEAARIQLAITPGTARYSTANAGKADAAVATVKGKSGALSASNFRITIAGLETATTRVSKIEPISVRFKSVAASVGEARDYERTPGQVDVSNLVLTLSEVHAAPFFQWHEDFVVKGKSSDADEKNGTIEFLASNMQTVLYKLALRNIGIISIGPDKASTDQVRHVRVECYVESLQLEIP
jgi:hypothetical protein